jgi:hypothetical protein
MFLKRFFVAVLIIYLIVLTVPSSVMSVKATTLPGDDAFKEVLNEPVVSTDDNLQRIM